MTIDRKTRLDCERVQEAFLRFVDQDLEREFAEGLEAHLSECSDCESEWKAYRSTVALLRSLEPLPAPGDIVLRIRARLDRPTPLERILGWMVPLQQRAPAAIAATICFLLILTGVLVWRPWSPLHEDRPQLAYKPGAAPMLPYGTMPVASWDHSPGERILPGAEEIMRPFKALVEDQDRRFVLGATLHEDIVLDLTGSEEVFERIQEILRESSGRMFLMGIRHRESGRVVKSKMVLEIPLEHYARVMERLESLGKVWHLFADRDTVPLPPDRLRIRVVGVNPTLTSEEHLREVSWE
jgi:hypothetical protein